jgi:hypothetical protein
MKKALLSLLMIAFAATAFAGANPQIRIYIDGDPNNMVHEVEPAPGAVFDVYVCLDCFGNQANSGTRGTAFLLVRTFAGFKLAQTALWPGLDFGDAEVDGWTMAFDACAFPDADGVVCIGMVTYLYNGVEGTLDLAPHPGTGREVLDCEYLSDDYCIYANLGVWMPPNPGEPDCLCEANPVEGATWGGIKSLYR